jgi:hypothetical protein
MWLIIAAMTGPARSGRVLRVLVLVVVALAAFLAGVLTERLRFDVERSDMLRRYDRALREHQRQIIQTEKRAPEPATR